MDEIPIDTSLKQANSYKTGWNLLRHELLFILWALMEVSLIAPLVLALTPWSQLWSPSLFTLWLLLLILIPFNLSRLASLVNVPGQKQQIIIAIGLVIAILLSWRMLLYSPRSPLDLRWLGEFFDHINEHGNPFWSRDLAIFVTVTLMWWRGIALVGRRVDIGDVGLRMRAGILLLLLLVAGIAGSLLEWPVTPFILLFFFASLAAVALTRVEQLELGRTGQSFPLSFRWLLVVAGAAALLAFLTGITAGFAGGDSVTSVVGWFAPIWQSLRLIVTTVLITVSFLSTPLLAILDWLLNLLLGFFGPILENGLAEVQVTVQAPFATPIPEELGEAVETASRTPRQLLALLIMLFFVLLVALALGRLVRIMRQTSQIESEMVSPFGGLSPTVKPGFGRRLADRLKLFRRWQAAASIRHIYREMCIMAADAGYARANFETPYEYLPTLVQAWPDNGADTRLLTEAYIRVRYGEIPETQDELNELKSAFKRLEEVRPTQSEAPGNGVNVKLRP